MAKAAIEPMRHSATALFLSCQISTLNTPLRFSGQYFDPETGLHYNFHRYCDPTTARYTTPDP